MWHWRRPIAEGGIFVIVAEGDIFATNFHYVLNVLKDDSLHSKFDFILYIICCSELTRRVG